MAACPCRLVVSVGRGSAGKVPFSKMFMLHVNAMNLEGLYRDWGKQREAREQAGRVQFFYQTYKYV